MAEDMAWQARLELRIDQLGRRVVRQKILLHQPPAKFGERDEVSIAVVGGERFAGGVLTVQQLFGIGSEAGGGKLGDPRDPSLFAPAQPIMEGRPPRPDRRRRIILDPEPGDEFLGALPQLGLLGQERLGAPGFAAFGLAHTRCS